MAKKNLKKGIFITFEGPEGCGKSTHAGLTASFLRKEGFDVVYTREPGGTKVGDRIREALLNSKLEISPFTEMLLFEASRAELVRQIIRPALLRRKVVISDRFNDATHVYQAYAGKVSLKVIKRIESAYMKHLLPDLTVVLDIKAEDGLKKIHKWMRDRMESRELSFHKKVRKGYLNLARREKRRMKLVRTRGTKEETFKRVKSEVMNVIRRYKRPG